MLSGKRNVDFVSIVILFGPDGNGVVAQNAGQPFLVLRPSQIGNY
jgi:hypothetical protein